MLQIPASLDMSKLEEFISTVDTAKQSQKLTIPVDTKRIAFGGYATAIQAVNTWAYSEQDRILNFKPSSMANDKQVIEAIEQPHKFTALMMAKMFEKEGHKSPDLRKQIYELAKQKIEKQPQNLYGQNKGRLCWYSFVDHSTKGFDRNFYLSSKLNKPKLRGFDQITNIICAMVKQSAKVAGGGELPSGINIESIGRIFEELFANTHEHGSREQDRTKWLKPATRVIYTYGINLSEKAIQNATKHEEWLSSYLLGLANTKQSTRRFVEISLVDSGLGYYGRWLADHPADCDPDATDINSEYQILKKCFQFRKSSTGKDSKGHGLTAVMQNLTKLNGFIKIRSNRLSIYRDFVNQPFNSSSTDTFDFSDWDSKQSCLKTLSKQANARGVAVTILIPLYDRAVEGEAVK